MKKAILFLIGCVLLIAGFWIGLSVPFMSRSTMLAKELQKLEEDLSSPEGLMRLVPQLKNKNGEFEIPNPNEDLQKYLIVRQSLLNIIEMALSKANALGDPYMYSSNSHSPLKMPVHWRAAEVGFSTDATTIPDFSNGGFGYTGKSFLDGVIPVEGTQDSFYTIPGAATYINLMPTSISCINRIMETSGLNGGTMIATSYALGRKDGRVYLVVNGCQNPAKTVTVNNMQLLAPAASSYLGMQLAEE
jgi:hypothetical protein